MKGVPRLCTKSNWVSRGRDCLTIADQQDGEGHEMFTAIEGVPIQEPATKAIVLIRQVQRFPTYLLDGSNSMIGRIMERAFEPVAPRAQVTLVWLHWLQRIEVAFQNMLAQNRVPYYRA